MGYWAVMSLVKRLRRRAGIDFHPHLFRHTHATALLRAGVRLEVVSELLTHASVRTTGIAEIRVKAAIGRSQRWTGSSSTLGPITTGGSRPVNHSALVPGRPVRMHVV
ncbi:MULTISPECIES: tyrosine-type recombinase/integrase [Candidatus Dormibacteria]